MSTEDRVLRLENAFTTLVELAAEQNRRMNDQQRRVERLEDSLVTLIELTRSHHEGLDEVKAELRAAQADTERKIGALADAQIRADERSAGLTDAMRRLADAQVHTDERLDALIDIVQSRLGGQS
jgi:peptidoglycan hydrolase CwlO-like protein